MSEETPQNRHARATYGRAVRSYREGRYAEAIDLLEPLCGGEDTLGSMAKFYRGAARRDLGLEHLAHQRYSLAERCLRAAMTDLGRTADLGAYLAQLYVRTHRIQSAEDQLEAAVRDVHADARTFRRLAQLQWHAGRREEAYLTLRRALRLLGNEAELHLQIGLFLSAEQRYEDAHAAFARAANADRALPEAFYYLGLTHCALGRPHLAVPPLQRALDLRGDDLLAAYQLAMAARAAQQQGHPVPVRPPALDASAAPPDFRRLHQYIQADPDFLDALLHLPRTAEGRRLDTLLYGVVRSILRDRPAYADLHYHASRLCVRLDRFEMALEHAQACVRHNPRFVRGLLHLADLHAQRDRCDEALPLLHQALACGADFPDVHCRLGELLLHSNAPAADTHLRRALQLRPGYARATRALEALAA